jgi:O-acetyl-ADP-ribose deacetylase (regulator of RNase III)
MKELVVKNGDIFESTCTTLVNAVNCVGVMGKGIALEFKRRYPEMFHDYVEKCHSGQLCPGTPYVFDNGDGTKILNFPTKNHWRAASFLPCITDGLDWFVENYAKFGIDNIAFPALGCGNGGLSWDIVEPIMHQKLEPLPIRIEIYAPKNRNKKEVNNHNNTGRI